MLTKTKKDSIRKSIKVTTTVSCFAKGFLLICDLKAENKITILITGLDINLNI